MSSEARAQVSPERIFQFAWGHSAPLILEAAIRNRVFDVLDEGPKTVAQVAADTGASERGLTILMNALVGFEFLSKDAEQLYALTEESATFLVSTKPSFQGGIIKHCSEHLIPHWLQLNRIVATGAPAQKANSEEGAAFFESFVGDIFPMSYQAAQVAAGALGIERSTDPVKVLDIGTGSGVWGIAMAQKSPKVTVTAVDWPNVFKVTRKMTQKFGLADRFQYVAGDLAEVDFGNGYNIATIGHILHSEGPERSQHLLRKVSYALVPGGTVVIAEFLVNQERTGPLNGLIFAVNMLVNTESGDTFSLEEIRGWLEASGFTDVRSLEAPSPSPLILATKK
jgi:2-polyprenyl-3-methyl-5-hydroxy-6-metoxy-1,4-benzoquinol methylase